VNNKLVLAKTISRKGGLCKIRYEKKIAEIKTEEGKAYDFDENVQLN
jgi:hypothetical protein